LRDGYDIRFGEHVLFGDDDFAVDAEGGWDTDDQVKIGGIEFVGCSQEAV
jgi:hypothetical protein